MATNDREFLERLKIIFRGEAEEHIRSMSAGLIELEKAPTPERRAELVEEFFREAHSLKGAARSVSLKDIESVCQPLEGVFSALKKGALVATPELFDLLHASVDSIARIVASKGMEGSGAEREEARRLVAGLGAVEAGAAPPGKGEEGPVRPRSAADERAASTGSVRISMERLDSLLLQAEEMVSIKMATGERTAESRAIGRSMREARKASKQLSEAALEALESRFTALTRAMEQDHRAAKRMVDEHLEGMKRAVMLPASSLAESFPKIVRDIARAQGKEAELELMGLELEIDKRILEEMKDPLVHLLRNCVDHGMRSPEERLVQGKSRGRITIAFSAKESRRAEIIVSDDGVGIDPGQVRAAAVKHGVLTREAAERLGEEESLALVFRSGVSTSPILTDISGRGLGLAIVREKVEKLGGSVSVTSKVSEGTEFRILLPLTLSTFRGVVVRVDERLFILPVLNVERVARANRSEIVTVEDREMIRIDGRNLALISLAAALGLPPRELQPESPTLFVAVLASANGRVALIVDEVLGELQVMQKNLGRQLRRVRNVDGAAILGNGKAVPVLNASDLIKSAMRAGSVPTERVPAAESPKSAHILVAEDSITARTLLKSILEGSGYRVTTAVDGAEAYALARAGEFNLLVSDVDMPQMSGFELTERIRADKRLSDLPVVLVTALESREDRERGIDAGADAYIVKSSFDQSNLLDALRRLL